MLGSFMLLYAVLTLYGSYLLYTDVEQTQCNPSNAVPDIDTCSNSGPQVFGAMLSVAFAAQGLSQALLAIDRTLGSEETVVTKTVDLTAAEGEAGTSLEETYVLTKYEIDSSSHHGLMPSITGGEVVSENVKFACPTRRDNLIFDGGFNLKIEAGKTVCLVGPSGGGKSTTIGLIEGFYDPISGSVRFCTALLQCISCTLRCCASHSFTPLFIQS
ncbi:hypothetical protein HJC23_008138 [Cyclotella cryptica]|uniref:ABC transporter domain-containing protein n=1 Tax=Cyclotella cryptica TaxID=29204 RepID=A0ABD3PL78_9STRA